MRPLEFEAEAAARRLQDPEADSAARAAAGKDFLSAVESGKKSFADCLVLPGEAGEVVWAYSLMKAQEGVYYALAPRGPRTRALAAPAFGGLVREVLARVQALGAGTLHLRLPRGPGQAELSGILAAEGFRRKHERVEFRTPVAELPAEGSSPFSWRPVQSEGDLTLTRAAELLERAGQGDPDWDPADKPEEMLKAYLSDDQLYGGLDAVQVGFIEGEPAAVVIAQVNPGTGWSRITYMGLLPAFRGRGLGKSLHRHGFEMLRRQGGREYHGGTVDTNASMIALFRAHGCREFRRVEEWSWVSG